MIGAVKTAEQKNTGLQRPVARLNHDKKTEISGEYGHILLVFTGNFY